MQYQLALITQKGKVTCLQFAEDKCSIYKLRSETQLTTTLSEAVELVSDYLKLSTQLKNVSFVFVVSESSELQEVEDAISVFKGLAGEDWQAIHLDLLRSLSGYKLGTNFLQELPNALMSLTLSSNHRLEKIAQEEQAINHRVQQLIQEKNVLDDQVKSLQGVPVEYLVTFLPAIYKNLWSSIRPDELAILAGSLEAPSIPSPYQEPSQNTVLALKKKLIALPELEKQRIREFCHSLEHKLTVRPEMQSFLEG